MPDPDRGRPLVMGVVNVTPDSFFDGGRFFAPDAAIAHARDLVAEGADLIDVGGESSRPGAGPVEEAEEIRRVIPVIEALSGDVRISVDTVKPGVARAAVEAGATLINDVSGTLWPVAAACGVGWVAMHMQGTPRDMQRDPRYGDVVDEVFGWVMERAAQAVGAGVSEVWVDPGIGFGKTAAHNLALLGHLDRLVAAAGDAGHGVLVGTSRKRFLGVYGSSDAASPSGGVSTSEAVPIPADDRLEASLATATWAMACGVGMVRVHDVSPTRDAAILVGAMQQEAA